MAGNIWDAAIIWDKLFFDLILLNIIFLHNFYYIILLLILVHTIYLYPTYLFTIYITQAPPSRQAEAAEEVARLHRNILDGTYAFGTTKLLCLSVTTTPKILYKHNINSLSLKRTLATDKIFYPLVLQASHHMWGFPKALLHLSPTYCGHHILLSVCC